MIEAYISNLGKYNEGELCGEYLKLPASKDDVKALLSRIGVDGVVYEETFITDYETGVEGLANCLGEYESVDELNYLASALCDLDDRDIAKFEAALDFGEHTSSVKELINLAQNLDCYDIYYDIGDHDDLGRYYLEEYGIMDVPDHMAGYIDYESYGRDVAINDGGVFTKQGYITENGERFIEYYGGRDEIPREYMIFEYPETSVKLPVKVQLEMYGRMVSEATAADRPALARDAR